MEIYYALKVQSTDEILMALLSQFDFESYEENEDHFIAYIRKDLLNDAQKSEVESIIKRFTDKYSFEELQPQNWNAIWEASFQPVVVGHFCQIRADFHPPLTGVRYDLVINPKMAFGTGHHATTHMMIQQMESIAFEGKSVFDFGCGTGILAILASKLGANEIDAIDIEHESYQNTIENSAINAVANVRAYEGDLDAIVVRKYDIILANINRNILIKYAEALVRRMNLGGILLFSGVLDEDKKSVIHAFEEAGLSDITNIGMDGWVCGKMELRNK